MVSRIHDVENALRQTFRNLVPEANIDHFLHGTELSLPFHIVGAHTFGMTGPGYPDRSRTSSRCKRSGALSRWRHT